MKNKLNSFRKNGFLTINNFLSLSEKKIILDVIFNELKEHISLGKRKNFLISDDNFHEQLILFRKKNPKLFGEIYDRLNLNARLRSLFYSNKFINCFSRILNISKNKVFLNGFMLRFDAPFDKRNSLDWHQDSPYYLMTYPNLNAGVCWIPITNNSKKNGTLVFIPNSHKKIVKFSSKKNNKFASEQKKIDITKSELAKSKHLNQNFGSASLLHLNLKHRSGKNISKKFRITLACRFHDMGDTFNCGKEIYNYNKRINVQY